MPSIPSEKQKRIAEEVAALHRIGINAGIKADSHAHTLNMESGKPLLQCQQALAKTSGDLQAARQMLHGTSSSDLDADALKGCLCISGIAALIVAVQSAVLVWLIAPLIMFVAKVGAVFGFLYLVFDVYPWIGLGLLFGLFSGRRK